MGYKTRKSIIQGSRYHKDLELAYGLDGSAMPDGRPKHSTFQKKDLTPGLEKAIDGGMPEEVVEDMGYDTSALPKYGPYRSEHVKKDKKQEDLVDVTERFKVEGNQNTIDHIAKGGKVFQTSDGSYILRSDA